MWDRIYLFSLSTHPYLGLRDLLHGGFYDMNVLVKVRNNMKYSKWNFSFAFFHVRSNKKCFNQLIAYYRLSTFELLATSKCKLEFN